MTVRFDGTRRRFLIASAAAGAGLALAFHLHSSRNENKLGERSKSPSAFRPNVWLRIGTDESVTVTVAKSEMGQGVWTALPMLVAEELEIDWKHVRVEQAWANVVYGNQTTGGSSSIRENWDILRQAGAVAREMLIGAAAAMWEVPRASCRAQEGHVVHSSTRRRLGYGQLANAAAQQPIPDSVELKAPEQFRTIGKPLTRLDTPSKINGSAIYGADVQLPGLLTAAIAHSPVFGGKAEKIDDTKARSVGGVRHIVKISTGVAVVADNFWSATQGLNLLEIEWSLLDGERTSSAMIRDRLVSFSDKPGVLVQDDGNVEHELAGASKVVEAIYETPFQAHATMEPMNCTAYIHDGICEVWAPTQAPGQAQQIAYQHAFSAPAHLWQKIRSRVQGGWKLPVVVHTTCLGGGFGRRLQQDYVAEAVQIAKAVNLPIKLMWSREEDMRHDFYRPASYNRLVAGLDKQGTPIVWQHKIVGPSINESLWPGSARGGHDPTATQGATGLPYTIPNIRVQYVMAQSSVPVGLWRSVGHSNNAFVTECFLDELAAAAGKDPLEFRLALLSNAPRLKAVLELAAKRAGWGRRGSAGRYQGLAVHQSYQSYVAQVAEVSVSDSGRVRVHRVVCAIDCGMVVNPNIVAAQMEGSVAFSLSAALKGVITLADGRVEQSNFHDYPILRMDEMPVVETHVVKSAESPTGVGEPGVPPAVPAVINAIFAATGRRIRRLPIHSEDLRRT